MAKRRVDRNHIIYRIWCESTGDDYIGLTVARGRAYKKSTERRWKDHLYQAFKEGRRFPLHCLIRELGAEAFKHEILHIVRGKKDAHAVELVLIKSRKPTLNVTGL